MKVIMNSGRVIRGELSWLKPGRICLMNAWIQDNDSKSHKCNTVIVWMKDVKEVTL